MVMQGSTQTGISIRHERSCRIGKLPFGNSQFNFQIADKQIPTDKNLVASDSKQTARTPFEFGCFGYVWGQQLAINQ